MNSLSIIIYLADVVPAIGSLAMIIAIASAIFTAISILVVIFSHTDLRGSAREEMLELYTPILKLSGTVFGVSALLACLLPTKDTMYLIAASELGEYLANTDVAKAGADMVKDLFEAISAYLKESMAETVAETKQ